MHYSIIELDERKNKITERLSTVYSVNLISIEEYERLIEYSQKIETEKELSILEKIVEGYNVAEINSEKKTIPDNIEKNFASILSSRKISGPMVDSIISNILGDIKITLTEEDLINKETTFNVSIILGSLKIIVPDSINVICNAIPLLGEVSIKGNRNNAYGKKLIIKGNIILGDITVRNK